MTEVELKDCVSELILEVEKHKWFISEKSGEDVGWKPAAQDWVERHFDKWQKQWKKKTAH